MRTYDYDAAVITAVRAETEGLMRCFEGWEKFYIEDDEGVTYSKTGFKASDGSIRRLVTVQQFHMGMTACTLSCQKLIEHFRPKYLIMVGIAAGIAGDAQLYGDVIIPDPIWDYSTGKFVGKEESDM